MTAELALIAELAVVLFVGAVASVHLILRRAEDRVTALLFERTRLDLAARYTFHRCAWDDRFDVAMAFLGCPATAQGETWRAPAEHPDYPGCFAVEITMKGEGPNERDYDQAAVTVTYRKIDWAKLPAA